LRRAFLFTSGELSVSEFAREQQLESLNVRRLICFAEIPSIITRNKPLQLLHLSVIKLLRNIARIVVLCDSPGTQPSLITNCCRGYASMATAPHLPA
jgi:hypothetical protein